MNDKIIRLLSKMNAVDQKVLAVNQKIFSIKTGKIYLKF